MEGARGETPLAEALIEDPTEVSAVLLAGEGARSWHLAKLPTPHHSSWRMANPTATVVTSKSRGARPGTVRPTANASAKLTAATASGPGCTWCCVPRSHGRGKCMRTTGPVSVRRGAGARTWDAARGRVSGQSG